MSARIYTVYAEKDDMTFIMEEADNYIKVIGFYFGEPSDDCTEKYKGSLVAEIE